MKRAGTWIALVVVLFALHLGWKWVGGGGEDASAERGDPALLYDRVWIDRIPESRTEYVHFLVALSDHPLGIFQKSSDYRVEAELFAYARQRKETALKIHFPQTRSTKKVSFKVEHCDNKPPFDLCLKLNKNPWGGPKRYYSMTEDSRLESLSGQDLWRRVERLRAEPVPSTLP